MPRHTEAPVRIFFVLRLWLIPSGRCFASHYSFQKGCMLFSSLLLFGGTCPFLAPLDIGSPSLCGTSGYRTILVRPNVLGHCACPFALNLCEVLDLPGYRMKFGYHIHPGSRGKEKECPNFHIYTSGPQQQLEGESSTIPGAGIPKS